MLPFTREEKAALDAPAGKLVVESPEICADTMLNESLRRLEEAASVLQRGSAGASRSTPRKIANEFVDKF